RVSTTLISLFCLFLFFFTATPPPEIYTLSLHDALPISGLIAGGSLGAFQIVNLAHMAYQVNRLRTRVALPDHERPVNIRYKHLRSEEHTSELQSQSNLVCRLLLEKKKKKNETINHYHE